MWWGGQQKHVDDLKDCVTNVLVTRLLADVAKIGLKEQVFTWTVAFTCLFYLKAHKAKRAGCVFLCQHSDLPRPLPPTRTRQSQTPQLSQKPRTRGPKTTAAAAAVTP